eukprot:6206527-Pleurochrysis_carterae.AAC.1
MGHALEGNLHLIFNQVRARSFDDRSAHSAQPSLPSRAGLCSSQRLRSPHSLFLNWLPALAISSHCRSP